MKTMDITLLRTLIAFAETGSCQGAAEAVNKTQAAISVHLRRLEDVAGKPLFFKDGRQLKLNADGHSLVSYARRILRLHNEALALDDGDIFTGTLRIGLPDDYIPLLLTTLLRAFDTVLPKAQLELHCAPSVTLRPMLKKNQLDLAILSTETDTQEGYVLRQEPAYWLASSGYESEPSEPLKLLLFPEGCILRKWTLNALDSRNTNYEIVCTSPNMQALKTALSHGLGVMVATQSNIPDGCTILSNDTRLPPLPDITIMLVANPKTHQNLVEPLHQEILTLMA